MANRTYVVDVFTRRPSRDAKPLHTFKVKASSVWDALDKAERLAAKEGITGLAHYEVRGV